MVTSPTKRTLDRCRKNGMTVCVVEKWNAFARIRQDMFGCIDIVALKPDAIIGIQATTKSNINARINKSSCMPSLRAWINAGGIFEVWGWWKAKNGRWHCDIVVINEGDLTIDPESR